MGYIVKILTERQRKNGYVENATALCSCGEIIELRNQHLGACECPNCGQWYNLFGQTLKNPRHWEEDY